MFEPAVGGHHGGYLRHLVHRWHETGQPGRLTLVCAPEALERYPEVAELMTGRASAAPVDAREIARWRELGARRGRMSQAPTALYEWELLTRYGRRLGATRLLVMYLDRLLQVPLALGRRAPCPVAGIYFRPSFHYRALTGARAPLSERARGLRQHLLLWRALRNPTLETVYSLDPTIVPQVSRWPGRRAAIAALPDPVEVPERRSVERDPLRARLGIEPGRRMALLFGVLTARKGLYPLLEALPLLPDEAARGLAIVLAGPVGPGDQQALTAALARVRRDSPAQVVLQDGFVAETEAQDWFAAADVILAPYQRHVGSSGIVIRAAAAQRPLLASDYGLMGEQTRRHRLGLTVDAADPRALADALARLLRAPASTCDPAAMRAFAAENTPQAFADALLTPPR